MPGGDAVSKAKMTTGFWPSGSGEDGKRRTAPECALDKHLDLGWNKRGRSRHLGNEQVDRTSLSQLLCLSSR